jgi:hypothetical protein
MRLYIYQVNSEYFTVEAVNMHDAMVKASVNNGVVLGEYSVWRHLFGE